MADLEDMISDLQSQNPDDSEDLADALQALRRQKLTNLERLAKLNDSQWQRLGLTLGIEALLREEVESRSVSRTESVATASPSTAPAPEPSVSFSSSSSTRPAQAHIPARSVPEDEEDEEEEELEEQDEAEEEQMGLYQRGAHGRRVQVQARSRETGSSAKSRVHEKDWSMELTVPDNLEDLWQQLLDDTLPPDKREALQASWDSTPNTHDRYMMFLEYSSYLRKQEVTEEEKAERKKQLEPLLREYGLNDQHKEHNEGPWIWIIMLVMVMFISGIIYYSYSPPLESEHDSQSL